MNCYFLDASLSSGFPPPPQFFDTVYSPSYFASNGQPTAIDQTKNRIWVRGDQHPSLMLFSWKIDMANQTFCFTRTPLLRQERLSQFPVRQSILAEVLSGLESPPTAGTSRRIIRPHPAPASKQVRNSFCKSWSPGLESSRDNRGE